ncbi:MAG: nitrile hydratase accessory protein [Pseudomonadota bacterium]
MSEPDTVALACPPLPDVQGGEPVFDAPWHAQVFAMTTALNEAGHFAWPAWAEAFGATLAATPQAPEQSVADHYFGCWLDTLERFLEAQGLAGAGQLQALQQQWDAAARATPHGAPIELAAARGGVT